MCHKSKKIDTKYGIIFALSIGSRCSKTQDFKLQSSVQFIEIPIVWHHQNRSQFWVRQFDEMSVGCPGDVCFKVKWLGLNHIMEWCKYYCEPRTTCVIKFYYILLGSGVSFHKP